MASVYSVPICSTASNSVWLIWISCTTSSGTSVCMNSNSTSNTTCSTSDIWCYWNSSHIITVQVTEEQARELAATQEEQTRQIEAARAATAKHFADMEIAKERAQSMLREHLTEIQKESLDKHKWFLVEGGKSKKTYRIDPSAHAHNITELNQEGKPVAKLCVHADRTIPAPDNALAQLLHLCYDEDHIIAKANRTNVA